MATIGSINVAITATTEKLAKGLKAAQALLGGFGGKIASIGGVLAEGTFGGMVAKFASVGAELSYMSQATGIAVGELSFLKYAAEQTGRGLDVFSVAIRTMVQKGIAPARFAEIAASVASIQDPLMRLQNGIYYFGKRGALGIVPIAQQLKGLRERFASLGGSFTDQMAKHAVQLRQSWGDVTMAMSNVAYEIGDILSPLVIKLTDYIASHGAAIKQWVADHSNLITVLAIASTTLAVLIPLVYAFSAAMKIATFVMGIFRAAALLTAINPVVATVIAITAAIAGLIYLILKATGYWEKFKESFGAGSKGNYISRHLAPKNYAPQEVPAGAGGITPIADSSVASNTSATNDMLSQILEQMKLSNTQGDRSPIAQPQVDLVGMR